MIEYIKTIGNLSYFRDNNKFIIGIEKNNITLVLVSFTHQYFDLNTLNKNDLSDIADVEHEFYSKSLKSVAIGVI